MQNGRQLGQRAVGEKRVPPAPRDAALGAWVCASLLGVTLGLAVAKCAQAWAREVVVPGAAIGSLLVLVSAVLTVLASARFHVEAPFSPPLRSHASVTATLSCVLVCGLAWAALLVIWAMGYNLPPAPAR